MFLVKPGPNPDLTQPGYKLIKLQKNPSIYILIKPKTNPLSFHNTLTYHHSSLSLSSPTLTYSQSHCLRYHRPTLSTPSSDQTYWIWRSCTIRRRSLWRLCCQWRSRGRCVLVCSWMRSFMWLGELEDLIWRFFSCFCEQNLSLGFSLFVFFVSKIWVWAFFLWVKFVGFFSVFRCWDFHIC